MTHSSPLKWPEGWPRCKTPIEGKYRFKKAGGQYGRRPVTLAEARDRLYTELEKLHVSSVVISSNFELNTRGEIDARARRPHDEAIALYFVRKGKPLVMAQDAFIEGEANLTSLALAIEAIRQLERHGGGVMFDKAFDGFSALPPPMAGAPRYPEWAQIMGIKIAQVDAITLDEVRQIYRQLAKERHPDAPGGSTDSFQRLGEAWAAAQRELGA